MFLKYLHWLKRTLQAMLKCGYVCLDEILKNQIERHFEKRSQILFHPVFFFFFWFSAGYFLHLCS